MTHPDRTPCAISRETVVFALLFGYYFLLILFPILRADRYCNDDLIRAFAGNYGWSENGRHLTNLLMRTLQFGASRVLDLAPLPQLLAIALLSWTGVLVARRFMIASPMMAALATLPLGAQPFFLENLSYRFDAPFMALAVFCALLPILMARADKAGWALGTLSLVASLNLYQPAITVFLVFALLEAAVADAAAARDRIARLSVRFAQFAVAAISYQLLFARSFKGWLAQRGTLVDSVDGPRVVGDNLHAFARFVVESFDPALFVLFAILIVLSLAALVVAGASRAMSPRHARSRWQNALIGLALLAVPCVALISVAGPMLALRDPVLMPRVMVGIGAWLSALAIAMHLALRTRPAWLRWQTAFGGVCALAFALATGIYGNALRAQDHYETAIAHDLANDLAALRATHPSTSHYLVTGSAALGPVTERMALRLPLLRSLVVPSLEGQRFQYAEFPQAPSR